MPISKILKIDNSYKCEFEICTKPELYTDNKYPISYLLVILHSIWFYYQNDGQMKFNIIIQNLLGVIDLTKVVHQGFYEKKLCELYRFRETDGLGLILIDRSNGCFPLVFYPNDNDPDHGHRISALQYVLNNAINESITPSYESILKNCKVWDNDVVQQINNAYITFIESNDNRDDS